eukprot:1003967_1
MSAVMTIMQKEASWAQAKKELSDPNFLLRLKQFDKDNISNATLKKIKKFTNQKDFNSDSIRAKSVAAAAMCEWVCAMEIYALVFRDVAPKRATLRDAQLGLQEKQAVLKKTKQQLDTVIEEVAKLQETYDKSENEKNMLRKQAADLETKLKRADQLVTGLSGEKIRWEASIENYKEVLNNLIGDCAIGAAFLSYCGPFNSEYRSSLIASKWMMSLKQMQIPFSERFQFSTFFAEETDIRDWNIQGLPTDDFSCDNGVLVTKSDRWPLMIDPQIQANKWIKNMHPKLVVVDPKMEFMRVLEGAVQFGTPVLMQDIGEELDGSLDPLLTRNFIIEGGRKMIKLGDKTLDYSEDFQFYLTTRLANPHYSPEMCTKAVIVNFSVKEKGLEDQLLGIVVRDEEPKLEEDKSKLVSAVAANKRQLEELEDEILNLLNNAKGSLLDDETLVETLQQSKITSEQVMQ